MSRSLFVVGMAAIFLAAGGSICRADDLNRPAWWNFSDANNAYQQWEFYDSSTTPYPDHGRNLFTGDIFQDCTITPSSSLATAWEYQDTNYPGGDGFWNLSSGGKIDVPAQDTTNVKLEKTIYVQVTWLPTPGNSNAQPIMTASAGPGYNVSPTVQLALSPQTTNGWNYSVYELNITPCPSSEIVTLSGNIFVDELVVDTYNTTPEPATAALLFVGAAAVLRRRRNRAG